MEILVNNSGVIVDFTANETGDLFNLLNNRPNRQRWHKGC